MAPWSSSRHNFFLLPKNPVVIVVSLLLVFALLFHPVRNFWWIERTRARRVAALAIFAVLLMTLGTLMWPNSNKQLCSDTNALAERMRNFNRERQLQLNEAENQFNTKLDAAKTEEEKVKIGQQKNEFFDQWLDRSDSDWDNIFLPKAQNLRKEIISRLATQSKDQKDQLMVDDVLFDGAAGRGAFEDTADALDSWASKLCPWPVFYRCYLWC